MTDILSDAAVVFAFLLLVALVLIVPCGGWLLRRSQSRPTETKETQS